MARLFYDLHVNEILLEPQTQRERVSTALKLGYAGVGLVHQAKASLAAQDRCSIKPTDLAALLSASKGVKEVFEQAKKRHAQRENPYSFSQFTRLNFPADDVGMAQAAASNSAVTGRYDLLAVQPQSERAFALACNSLEVDIIALDLSRRLPYRFKPALVKAAISRGLNFEICFGAALREAGSRRQLFANAQALCRETRGRNIIISSSARSAMELRGPHDVINLATMFGLSQQQAQQAISGNVAAAVQHAAERKAYKGVLSIKVATKVAGVQSAARLIAPHSSEGADTDKQMPADTQQGQIGREPAISSAKSDRPQRQKVGQPPAQQLSGQKRSAP